ncbi:MAG: hypothetical protein JSR97_09550 [Verrucomicrobia bacterium]|nr:hypothetical protein [Verrucomicrobiota bacterium]
MAKIFSNVKLDLSKDGQIWSVSNGATRRTLVTVNKTIGYENSTEFYAQLGYLDKGNHSFIFLNEPKTDARILGIFLNSDYGYQILEGKEIYSSCSQGGYGNSCSMFGIYEVGSLIEVNTYKNRNTPSYFRLTESGWVSVPPHEVNPSEVQEV